MVDPNLGKVGSNIGPRNNDARNSVNKTPAFHTIGPSEITAIRMRGAGGIFPLIGNDLTNRYAMTKRVAIMVGKMTSEKMTALQLARGTSPESFSEGGVSLFFMYPVIYVRHK